MKKHSEQSEHHKTPSKSILQKPVFIFLSFIIFCVIFVAIFYLGKTSAINDYNNANNVVPSIKAFGVDPQITDIFTKFGALFGIGLGLLMLISLYIWYGLASLFKLTKHRITLPIILVLVYGFWFLFGLKLAFFEDGYVQWANGIIFFTGRQLFYSTLIMIIIAVALFFLPSKNKGDKHE